MVKIIEAAAVLSARAGNLGGIDKMADHLDRVSKAGRQAKASMAGTAADMAKRVGDINAALSRIGNFRTLSRGLDDASISMRRAQQEAARLKRELDATASPSRSMLSAYDRASKAVERASAAFRQQGQAVREARAALDAAGIPVNTIAKQQAALTSALDKTTQAMQRQAQAGRTLNAHPWGAPPGQRASGSGVPLIQQIAPGGKPLAGIPVIPTGHPPAAMSLRGSVPVGEVATSIGAVAAARRALLAGADVDTERSQARQAGWSEDEIGRAEKAANRFAAEHGMSPGAALNMIREARPTFGGDLDTTLHNVGPFFSVATAMRQKSPHAGAEIVNKSVNDMVKAGEILGYSSDPQQLVRYADFMTRMAQVFGSQLRGEEVLNLAKRSKTAGSDVSFEFLQDALPTLLPELGGDATGVALMTLRQALVGGKMKKRAAENLEQLGLIDKKDMVSTLDEDVVGVRPSAVKGSETVRRNPLQWAEKYLIPAMDQKGVAPEDRSAIISTLFSDRNAEHMINLLVTQSARMRKDRGLVDQALGIEGVKTALRDDPYLAASRVAGGAANVGAALADPWLGPLKTAADAAASALNGVAEAARGNPGSAAAGSAAGGILGALGGWIATRGSSLWWRGAAAAGGAGAGALVGGALAPVAIGAGEMVGGAAREVGAVAAGKHYTPIGADAFADLRAQIAEANARIAGIEGRVHPSRRGEFNPEVDTLQRHVAELRNRIEVGSRTYIDAAGALGERGRGVVQPSTIEAVVKPDQVVAKADVTVSGSAEVTGRFEVTASSELIRIIDRAQAIAASVPLTGNGPGSTGRSMPEAAPNVGAANPMGPR